MRDAETTERKTTKLSRSSHVLTSCQSTFRAPAAASRGFDHFGLLGWAFLSAGRASAAGNSEIKVIGISSRVANLLEIGDELHLGAKGLSLRAGGRQRHSWLGWRAAVDAVKQSGCGLLDQVDVKLPGGPTGLPLFELASPSLGQRRVVVQRPAVPNYGSPLLGGTRGHVPGGVRAGLRGGARHWL